MAGLRLRKFFQCRLAVFGRFHRHALLFQHILGNFAVQGVILHQQHTLSCQIHPGRLLFGRLVIGGIYLQRNGHCKSSALVFAAFARNAAVHLLHHFLYQRKPQPRAVHAAVVFLALLRKGLEHVLLEFLAHANAGVGTGKLIHRRGAVTRKLLGFHFHCAVGPVVFDGVPRNVH